MSSSSSSDNSKKENPEKHQNEKPDENEEPVGDHSKLAAAGLKRAEILRQRKLNKKAQKQVIAQHTVRRPEVPTTLHSGMSMQEVAFFKRKYQEAEKVQKRNSRSHQNPPTTSSATIQISMKLSEDVTSSEGPSETQELRMLSPRPWGCLTTSSEASTSSNPPTSSGNIQCPTTGSQQVPSTSPGPSHVFTYIPRNPSEIFKNPPFPITPSGDAQNPPMFPRNVANQPTMSYGAAQHPSSIPEVVQNRPTSSGTFPTPPASFGALQIPTTSSEGHQNSDRSSQFIITPSGQVFRRLVASEGPATSSNIPKWSSDGSNHQIEMRSGLKVSWLNPERFENLPTSSESIQQQMTSTGVVQNRPTSSGIHQNRFGAQQHQATSSEVMIQQSPMSSESLRNRPTSSGVPAQEAELVGRLFDMLFGPRFGSYILTRERFSDGLIGKEFCFKEDVAVDFLDLQEESEVEMEPEEEPEEDSEDESEEEKECVNCIQLAEQIEKLKKQEEVLKKVADGLTEKAKRTEYAEAEYFKIEAKFVKERMVNIQIQEDLKKEKEKKIEEMEKSLRKKEKQLEETKRNAAKTAQQVAQSHSDALTTLNKNLKSLEEEKSKVQNSLKQSRTENQRKNAAASKLGSQNKILTDNVAQLEQKLKNAKDAENKTIQNQKNQIQNLNKKCGQLEKAEEAAKLENEKLKMEIEKMKIEFQKKLDAIPKPVPPPIQIAPPQAPPLPSPICPPWSYQPPPPSATSTTSTSSESTSSLFSFFGSLIPGPPDDSRCFVCTWRIDETEYRMACESCSRKIHERCGQKLGPHTGLCFKCNLD
ncbi:hypothetical protein L5515_003361 [Caenorhabditis briggsae]|uniref:Uncharacterized protein n=1 Tax=Caenorhabditis briggsae TaxID=6238 RepID=A0AAE9ELV0_CAEBR|nr:hypothetical protein L5515_003361 [Caenorhabditis briggsae]